MDYKSKLILISLNNSMEYTFFNVLKIIIIYFLIRFINNYFIINNLEIIIKKIRICYFKEILEYMENMSFRCLKVVTIWKIYRY